MDALREAESVDVKSKKGEREMDKILDGIKLAIAGAGGIFAYLFGPWDALIIALVIFVVADYITGVLKAAMQGKLSSAVGFKGLLKKVMIFVLVMVGTVVDMAIPAANHAIRAAVIMFYIANEGLSILENAGQLGLPLPNALKNALEKIKEHEEQEKPEEAE